MTSTRCQPKGQPPLCACGCGQPTNWNASHNHWSARLAGHQNIGQPSKLRLDKGEPPLCACGCGQPVRTYRHPTGWVRYLNNHAPRQPHTPEAIEKMRQAALARSESISDQMHTRVWTPGSRAKARQAKLAIADELAERMTGESNPNWRGGRDYFAERDASLNTYQRSKLYASIRQRDHMLCVLCGQRATKRALDVHHLDRDLSNNTPSNLVTLCHHCHMRIDLSSERESLLSRVHDYLTNIA